MKKLLFLICFLASYAGFSQECGIPPEKAIEELKNEVTVCGEVSQVYFAKGSNGQPTYLNLGGKFPNHSFTVVIWGDEREEITIDLDNLEGKRISVNGTVVEYRGKAQIVVEKESQITIL